MKTNKLEWNVLISNFNTRKIESYNIFEHYKFYDDCRKAWKKNKEDKEKFIEEVHRSLLYYFWAKCEWEVLIHHWPPHENDPESKIDVYDQMMLNWNVFADYIWNNREKFRWKELK